MQNKFSIYLTRFRKNHGTQHALLKMTDNWKAKLKMCHKVGVIYIGLSKAFNNLDFKLFHLVLANSGSQCLLISLW